MSCVSNCVGSRALLLGSRLSPLKTRAAASMRRQPWIFAANPVQTSSSLFFRAVMFAMLALSPPILTLVRELPTAGSVDQFVDGTEVLTCPELARAVHQNVRKPRPDCS